MPTHIAFPYQLNYLDALSLSNITPFHSFLQTLLHIPYVGMLLEDASPQ